MPLVLEDRLLSLFDLPIQLQQTLLPAGSWLAIATVSLAEGQVIDLRWLQIYIAALETSVVDDPCGTSGKNIVNSGFIAGSLATVFLIKDWAPTEEPWTQNVIDYLACPSAVTDAEDSVAPIIAVRPLTTALQVSTPGIYTFVVSNNTTNRNLSVTVDGTVTLDTDAIPTA